MLMMLCCGKGRLRRLVAATVETDHQAIADELVVAHPLHRRQILDPFGRRPKAAAEQRQGVAFCQPATIAARRRPDAGLTVMHDPGHFPFS
jgi:hypothetical protein